MMRTLVAIILCVFIHFSHAQSLSKLKWLEGTWKGEVLFKRHDKRLHPPDSLILTYRADSTILTLQSKCLNNAYNFYLKSRTLNMDLDISRDGHNLRVFYYGDEKATNQNVYISNLENNMLMVSIIYTRLPQEERTSLVGVLYFSEPVQNK